MFCSKCGAVIEEGTAFCAVCGTKVGGPAVTVTGAPAGTTSGKAPSSGAPKGLGIASMICGILALVGKFFGGIVEFFLPIPITMFIFPLSLAGIITGIISNVLAKKRNQKLNGMTTAGLITSIIAMVLWVVETVITTIITTVLLLIYVGFIVLYIIGMAASIGSMNF